MPITSNGKDAEREARRQIADHKGAWRNRLLADRRMSNAAKVVGCAIAEHINRASKEASAGVRRLALILHMSQSQVSEAIHELVNAGLIDVQWGAGKKSSTFKLIIDPEKPDLFLFDKYALDDFAEAAKVRRNELSSVRPAERKKGRQRSPGRTLDGPLAFEESARSVLKNARSVLKSARSVLPGERNPVLTPDNPGGTPGVTVSDEDSQSIANSASEDAPIPTTDGPVARTACAALQQPLAEPEQQPLRINSIGVANGADADGGAHAGPGFDAVCRSASQIFGAKGDAVAARLLAALGNDVEEALDTLAVAADEADPMAYLKSEVERLHNDGKLR